MLMHFISLSLFSMPMSAAISSGYSFHHPAINASVLLMPRRDSRSFRARWQGQQLRVTLPYGATETQVRRFLDEYAGRLLDMRPRQMMGPGKVITFPEGTISLVSGRRFGSIRSRRACGDTYNINIEVTVPAGADLADAATMAIVSRHIGSQLRIIAAEVLLPFARAVSARIGMKPAGWSVATGKRTLGSCSRDGHVRLSCMLMLLPVHLREYVVCHELAHLRYMNHSADFHALADRLCNGRERSWAAELRKFEWPLPR